MSLDGFYRSSSISPESLQATGGRGISFKRQMVMVKKEPHNFTVCFRQMCVVTKGKGAQEATTVMIDLLFMGPFKTPCCMQEPGPKSKNKACM